jgi:hypothetical protein
VFDERTRLDLGRQSDRASAGDLARSPDSFVLPGTPVCLSSLLAAGRYQELLNLIEMAPFVCWDNRHWGVQAWAAMGKRAEAIRYAEASRGLNDLTRSLARASRSCSRRAWPTKLMNVMRLQRIGADRT